MNLKLLLSLSVLSAIPLSSAHAIVGGEEVAANELIARTTVAIYFVSGKDAQGKDIGGLCTGSILNNQYIMTAAHCVTDMKGGVVVFARTFNKDTPKTQFRQIVSARFNLDYPLIPALDHNDVGLVRFAGGIPEGYQAVPVLDPHVSGQYLKAGQQILIAGYGTTGNPPEGSTAPDTSGILRKLVTQIDSPQGLVKGVVTGTVGKTSCHGDSGGPAFITVRGQNYLWGVLSRGDCQNYAIFTRLTSNFFGTPARP